MTLEEQRLAQLEKVAQRRGRFLSQSAVPISAHYLTALVPQPVPQERELSMKQATKIHELSVQDVEVDSEFGDVSDDSEEELESEKKKEGEEEEEEEEEKREREEERRRVEEEERKNNQIHIGVAKAYYYRRRLPTPNSVEGQRTKSSRGPAVFNAGNAGQPDRAPGTWTITVYLNIGICTTLLWIHECLKWNKFQYVKTLYYNFCVYSTYFSKTAKSQSCLIS